MHPMAVALMLDKYAKLFQKLGRTRHPHKACLLLAVMELAERRDLPENKIYYGTALIESFKRYLEATKSGPERNPETAHYPMLHLKANGFWHLQHHSGKKSTLDEFLNGRADAKRSPKFVRENVAYAELDRELYDLLLNADTRAELRKILTDAWQKDYQDDIHHAVQHMQKEAEYEHKLINATLDGILCAKGDLPPKAIRKPVFRRLVLDAYNYRCAATGWRFSMPDRTSLLDAAHIHPFSESNDDRTINGMALTPNIHRAMDRHLITPGPDRKWHVSEYLGKETNDIRELQQLDGKEILSTKDGIDKPSEEALEWRLEEFQEKERQRK